jgi:uncharacterized short protein YbdD (DUF466 family)
MEFDLVIPVGPKDEELVKKNILCNKNRIDGYRNIYLITVNDNVKVDGCITINENIFPFNKQTVIDILGTEFYPGWYLQQLLKLYAGFVIPDILERYLVFDVDVFLLKNAKFIQNDKIMMSYSEENHRPYMEHMSKLHPSLKRVYGDKSGIHHHMMFEKKYIQELFDMVEEYHKKDFYLAFLDSVPENYRDNTTSASEYEIYFNFMLMNHKDKVIIRKLEFCNSDCVERYINSKQPWGLKRYSNTAKIRYSDHLHGISFHWHVRNKHDERVMKNVMASINN